MTADQLPTEIVTIARENGMPMSLVLELFKNRNNEPLAKRIFTTWATEIHHGFDERIYGAMMKALGARAGVFEAVTRAALQEAAAREAVADLRHVDERVARKHGKETREAELERAQHETRLLEEREKQHRLRPNELQGRLETEALKAQIAEQQQKRRDIGRKAQQADSPEKALRSRLEDVIRQAAEFKDAQAAIDRMADEAAEEVKAAGGSPMDQDRRRRQVRNLGTELLQKIAREQAEQGGGT